MADTRPLKDRGVPEGFRRYTAVFNRADYQILHDWADTVHVPFHSVLAKATAEYIERHIAPAAQAGHKVKRPKKENENTTLALETFADFYESENATSPFDEYL